MGEIRIEHRIVGTQHVFTSPDVPGLIVAHRDRDTAEADVPAAIDMLRVMEQRLAEKRCIKNGMTTGAAKASRSGA